jgi:L-seryl-tRNA(Ser) seleniumtransferase
MQAEFTNRAERIAAHLKTIPTVSSRIVVPEVANHVAHLHIKYDQTRVKIAPLEVADALRHGKPCIELNPDTGTHHSKDEIVVGVWMLQPGEDMIVAQRLYEVLSGRIAG